MPRIEYLSGSDVEPQSAFVIRLKQLMKPGTDDVTIGSTDAPIPGGVSEEVDAGSMADVMKKVDGTRFLVRGWIPFGMTTMIVAEPGIGKSAFALGALVRPIIMGGNWFNGMPGPHPPGDVLWCDTEGSAAINVQRIKDWGLPAERIKVPFGDDPLKPVNLSDSSHLEQVEGIINKYQTKLVVIDSLRGAHDGDENNSRVGQVLQRLGEVAERSKAAIVVIHHARKLAIDEEITANSSRGSNALLALVRSQIGIDKPDKKGEWCRAQILKENLGLKPKPIGFRIQSTGIEFGAAPEKPRTSTEKDDAERWLRQRMKPGAAYRASEILKEAEQIGLAERTVRKAAVERLGIKPIAERKDGHIVGWLWKLT